MIKKAVIPAAGLGTRFLPYTKSIPKEMLPLMNKPILHVIIDCLTMAGIEEVVIVVNENKRMIIEYFQRNGPYETLLKEKDKEIFASYSRFFDSLPRIKFVKQRTPAGLADALLMAEEEVGHNPFLVVLGDVIISNGSNHLRKLISLYGHTRKNSIGLYAGEYERIHTVGVAEILQPRTQSEAESVSICKVIEKPNAQDTNSRLVIAGSYIFTPNIFEILRKQAMLGEGSAKERDLSFALNTIASNGELMGLIHNDTVYDIGTPANWFKLNAACYADQFCL